MVKFVQKILNFDIPLIKGNGKDSFQIYSCLENMLTLENTQINTEQELHLYIVDVFTRICDMGHFSLSVYYSENGSKTSWQSVTHSDIFEPGLAAYINENHNHIFETDILFHKDLKITPGDTFSFISLHLGNTYYYIFRIHDRRKQVELYHLLTAKLKNFLSAYYRSQNESRLMEQVKSLQSTLATKENALLEAEKTIKRKVYDLHTLVEASNEIYSILNFKQLINSALLTIIGQVGFQSAFILMYNAEKHKFSNSFHKGLKEAEAKKFSFNSDSPLVGYFLKNRIPQYLTKLEKQLPAKQPIKKFKDAGIFLLAPIIYSERLQGIIGTGEKLFGKSFTQTDFEIFHILVNIISISIGNACLYEEVKNLSLTDGMTNLHNYRYFQGRLREEINRAKRNKTEISLIMLDIDHFKNYNDTLGHQAGDEALRMIGKLLKKTVRDDDIVTRYGGEEFCIILPGIKKNSIKPLAERIRKSVEKAAFYKEEVQPSGRVTISLGGSNFPKDADNMNELIHKADEALYKAKSMGRNQVRIF